MVKIFENIFLHAWQTATRDETRLPGEPLRDQSGVKFALLVVSAPADHPITVLNLAGINVVDLFTAVLLTGPLGRTVVVDDLLSARAPLTNGQRRFILIATRDHALPARLLRGLLLSLLLGGSLLRFLLFGALLREYRHRQREDKYRREQQ